MELSQILAHQFSQIFEPISPFDLCMRYEEEFQIEEYNPSQNFRSSRKSAMLRKLYSSLRKNFCDSSMTQQRQQILLNISANSPIFLKVPLKKVYKMLNKLCNLLLMNNVEIVYWSLLLKQNFNTGITSIPTKYLIFFGLLTKSHLKSREQFLLKFLDDISPGLNTEYMAWLNYDFINRTPISDINLCKSYKQLAKSLKKFKKSEDYGELVSFCIASRRKKRPAGYLKNVKIEIPSTVSTCEEFYEDAVNMEA